MFDGHLHNIQMAKLAHRTICSRVGGEGGRSSFFTQFLANGIIGLLYLLIQCKTRIALYGNSGVPSLEHCEGLTFHLRSGNQATGIAAF